MEEAGMGGGRDGGRDRELGDVRVDMTGSGGGISVTGPQI